MRPPHAAPRKQGVAYDAPDHMSAWVIASRVSARRRPITVSARLRPATVPARLRPTTLATRLRPTTLFLEADAYFTDYARGSPAYLRNIPAELAQTDLRGISAAFSRPLYPVALAYLRRTSAWTPRPNTERPWGEKGSIRIHLGLKSSLPT